MGLNSLITDRAPNSAPADVPARSSVVRSDLHSDSRSLPISVTAASSAERIRGVWRAEPRRLGSDAMVLGRPSRTA